MTLVRSYHLVRWPRYYFETGQADSASATLLARCQFTARLRSRAVNGGWWWQISLSRRVPRVWASGMVSLVVLVALMAQLQGKGRASAQHGFGLHRQAFDATVEGCRRSQSIYERIACPEVASLLRHNPGHAHNGHGCHFPSTARLALIVQYEIYRIGSRTNRSISTTCIYQTSGFSLPPPGSKGSSLGSIMII